MTKKIIDEEKPILDRKTKKKAKETIVLDEVKEQNATKGTKRLQKATEEEKKVDNTTKKEKSPKKAKNGSKDVLKQKEKVKLGDIGENESKIDLNEGVLEPIVAADLGIDMPESVHTKPKAPKPISNDKHKPNHVHKQKKAKKKKPNFINSVGEKSKEIILTDNANDKSEKEYEIYKKLLLAQKTRQLLYGEVYGIEPNEKLGKVIIAVMWNGVKISIPDSEYFEPNFEFGSRYKIASAEEQLKRRAIMAGFQNGARVAFIVKAVQRDVIRGGEYDGEYNIACVASRKEAMELMRDIYFYHKERVHARNSIKDIKIGDIAEANVIAVKEDVIVVECFGVETRIPAREASEEYIENCKDFFSPGDTIKVKVKKVYINGSSSVYLTVSGKINDSSKFINTMNVKSTYLGTVESVNRNKKIYNVRLKNGVLAGVLFDNVQGNVPLFIGNKVTVKVSKVKDTYVYGSALKL